MFQTILNSIKFIQRLNIKWEHNEWMFTPSNSCNASDVNSRDIFKLALDNEVIYNAGCLLRYLDTNDNLSKLLTLLDKKYDYHFTVFYDDIGNPRLSFEGWYIGEDMQGEYLLGIQKCDHFTIPLTSYIQENYFSI